VVLHRHVGLAISIAVVACGGADTPPPTKEEPVAAQGESFSGFRFAPSFEKHAPQGTKLAALAEISLPHEGRMKAIVATHRDDRKPALQIDLWTFAQRGDEDVEPIGDPKLLLQLDARGARGTPELEAVKRDLAAPVSVVARPQGLGLETAEKALERLHARARTIRDDTASGDARLDALEELMRGLDDDVWLSQSRVPWMIDTLAVGPWLLVGPAEGAPHRARLRARPGEGKPEYSLAFLRKRDGWVLQSFEQRR
jgi:hypothetical protein